jgi:hypothetical protein
MNNFAFEEPKNLAVVTTRSIAIERNPILRVYHGVDGDWQFHHEENPQQENAMVLALSEILEIDESINELSDLPRGWMAWRNNSEEIWQRKKNPLRAV